MLCLLHVSFLIFLFFDPGGGGDMFLSNVSSHPPDYTALLPRRQSLSCSGTDSEEVKWTEIGGF
jgi:hypothetical protein